MILAERISADPKILGGKPVIEGTELAAGYILELLAAGETHQAILSRHPELQPEDILACIDYGRQVVHDFG